MDENTTIEQRIPALNHPTPKVNRLRAARDKKEHRGRKIFASILNAAVPATDGEVANPTKPPRKRKKIAATRKTHRWLLQLLLKPLPTPQQNSRQKLSKTMQTPTMTSLSTSTTKPWCFMRQVRIRGSGRPSFLSWKRLAFSIQKAILHTVLARKPLKANNLSANFSAIMAFRTVAT